MERANMNPDRLTELLNQVKNGKVSVEQAVKKMKHLPFEDIDFARIDHHRSLRKGFPEVIFGEGKTDRQIIEIMARMKKNKDNILVTRLDAQKAAKVRRRFPEADYHPLSRVLTCLSKPIKTQESRGLVLVISAGTSDMPVAEEALLTAQIMGNPTEYLYDVGIAGLAPPDGQTGKDPFGFGFDRRGRDGRGPAQRGRGVGGPAGHCRSHQHRLRGQL